MKRIILLVIFLSGLALTKAEALSYEEIKEIALEQNVFDFEDSINELPTPYSIESDLTDGEIIKAFGLSFKSPRGPLAKNDTLSTEKKIFFTDERRSLAIAKMLNLASIENKLKKKFSQTNDVEMLKAVVKLTPDVLLHVFQTTPEEIDLEKVESGDMSAVYRLTLKNLFCRYLRVPHHYIDQHSRLFLSFPKKFGGRRAEVWFVHKDSIFLFQLSTLDGEALGTEEVDQLLLSLAEINANQSRDDNSE